MVSDQPGEPKPIDLDLPLPRGRHDIPIEEVERHQRDRIVAAVAAVMAEHGYPGLTVERIIVLARVSRTTFYAHFADKREAVIGAHELIFADFRITIEGACGTETEWPEMVEASIAATLEFVDALPAQAQLLATGFLAADLSLARRVRDSYDQLAAMLREGRRYYPEAAALPALTEPALVGAVVSILARHLVNGEPQPAELGSELTQCILIPYLAMAGPP